MVYDTIHKVRMQDREENIYGKSKCIFKTSNIKKYFKIRGSDNRHDRIYVFLHDGGRAVCVKPDRYECTVGDQPDRADHSARDGDFHHACYWRKCGYYEKNGRA